MRLRNRISLRIGHSLYSESLVLLPVFHLNNRWIGFPIRAVTDYEALSCREYARRRPADAWGFPVLSFLPLFAYTAFHSRLYNITVLRYNPFAPLAVLLLHCTQDSYRYLQEVMLWHRSLPYSSPAHRESPSNPLRHTCLLLP